MQKIAQKHGQNVIFSFCTEEKVDKKWAKTVILQGVGWDRQNGLPRQFFTTLLWFSKKLLHRAISIVHVTRGSVSVFMISESTTKLVTAHADSIFKFDDGVLKTRGALVGNANDGTQDRFHVWGQHGFHSWSSTRIAINI